MIKLALCLAREKFALVIVLNISLAYIIYVLHIMVYKYNIMVYIVYMVIIVTILSTCFVSLIVLSNFHSFTQ